LILAFVVFANPFTVLVARAAPPTVPPQLRIYDIQGRGAVSTLTGPVTTSGVVTGDFQGVAGSDRFHPEQLQGFFLQDPEGDADSATSDGIFVYCGSSCPESPVSVGDAVKLTGEVSEFFGRTQLSVTAGQVQVLSKGNALPPATKISRNRVDFGDLERFEGMLVSFVDTLTVTDLFHLGRYGQIGLYAGPVPGARPFQFTPQAAPDSAGFAAHRAALASRTIVLDDDSFGNNQALAMDLNVFYPEPGLSSSNFLRAGDTITGLSGVLDYAVPARSADAGYRVRPVPGRYPYVFARSNPRVELPQPVGGSLRVVSANLANFFWTLDTTADRDDRGCGPSGAFDCRGADSAQELLRQTDKLRRTLCTLDGDIVGVSEIENDPSGRDSLSALVRILNDPARGCGRDYRFVDAGILGTDAIKVGLLYRADSVRLAGPIHVVDGAVNAGYRDHRNRPTLIGIFEERRSGERLVVATHHLKSKGSPCSDDGDADLGDGQGNCSRTRAEAAAIVADYIRNVVIPLAGTDRVLAIGDLNAYRNETAITAFTQRGYVDLIRRFNGDRAYSFVFGGQLGYLDHALGLNLSNQVTGVSQWHINADEAPLLDYNDDVKDLGERGYEEKPDNLPLYEATPYRSSDHDPILIGLDLRPGYSAVAGN
jgi:predicted extracellular nuclease